MESDPDGAALLTTEAARYTALLMTYQDTIHVALQKIRAARLAGIRVESRAKDDQLVDVYEYLHPEVSEVTDTMPAVVGKALRANKLFAAAVKSVGGGGIVINTTSVVGFTTLTTLANLRPMRPTTLRFKRVQKERDAWLPLVAEMARTDYALGVEVTKAAHVIKGYGETFEHGMESFEKLLAAARRMKGVRMPPANAARDCLSPLPAAWIDASNTPRSNGRAPEHASATIQNNRFSWSGSGDFDVEMPPETSLGPDIC